MWVNLIGFNLIWLGLVAIGNSFIVVALLMLAAHLYWCANINIELCLIFIVSVIGTLVDSILTHYGVFDFAGVQPIPYWLMVLWLAFACTLSHGLRYLTGSVRLQFIIGSTLAPLSYIAGERLSAVSFGYSTLYSYFILAILWGPLMVLFYAIKGKLERVGTRYA